VVGVTSADASCAVLAFARSAVGPESPPSVNSPPGASAAALVVRGRRRVTDTRRAGRADFAAASCRGAPPDVVPAGANPIGRDPAREAAGAGAGRRAAAW